MIDIWKHVYPKYLTMSRIEIWWIIINIAYAWINPFPEYVEASLFMYIIGAVMLYYGAIRNTKKRSVDHAQGDVK